MMVGTINGAMKLPSAQSRPAKLPRTSARTEETSATRVDIHIASIQRGSPKKVSYQRSEKLGGGKVSALAEEKDIGTTISSGTVRNTRPNTPIAASRRRVQGVPVIMPRPSCRGGGRRRRSA